MNCTPVKVKLTRVIEIKCLVCLIFNILIRIYTDLSEIAYVDGGFSFNGRARCVEGRA